MISPSFIDQIPTWLGILIAIIFLICAFYFWITDKNEDGNDVINIKQKMVGLLNINNNQTVNVNKEPIHIMFNPSQMNIYDSLDVSSYTDNGIGDYNINFSKQIQMPYFIHIKSDKNYNFKIKNKNKNGFRIIFESEPSELIKIDIDNE